MPRILTEAQKQRARERAKEWHWEHKDRANAVSKKWALENKEKACARAKKWRLENQGRARAISAAKKARKRNAVPGWANKFFIEEIYDLARRRTALRTGGHVWHVDHIVPLRSKLVCGLHVHNNLRVITAQENMAKKNRHWPDMP